jgi:predicted AlkP superfamily pyrophosphatase or phosphodiesterase
MKNILIIFICFLSINTIAQNVKSDKVSITKNEKPKLVVGIVVDQMRWDYVNKFKPFFTSSNGFIRFLNEGSSCDNTLIPYVPTVTACGHASVYTGSVPSINGIAGNNWFDNEKQKTVYCVEDPSVQSVGVENNAAGKMSPINLWTSTIGDEMKIASNFKSKVIGISLKDRGAILPAGHSADGAFWYDSKTGKFISSTYYGPQLPNWVNQYNSLNRPDSLYTLDWNLSLAKSIYEANCDNDQNEYESTPLGKEQTGFPYHLHGFIGKDYSKITSTPHGNTLVAELAQQAILNEKLGQDNITDLLAISFSSPDYIGHSFGPDSWETLDGYVKLDALIAQLFATLDKQVGKNNYTVFLTADHAVANIPGFSKKHKLPGGIVIEEKIKKGLSEYISSKGFDSKLVSAIREYNIHFNHSLMDSLMVSNEKLIAVCTQYLEKLPEVLQVVDARKATAAPLPQNLRERIANGFNPQRAGDLLIVTKSGYVDGGITGTSHGVIYNYDAHIPFMIVGNGIKHGVVNSPTFMTDIAPTITTLLGIQMPSGSIGKPVLEVLK